MEVVAESLPAGRLPEGLRALRDTGVPVVAHGVGLGLGGAEPPAPDRLDRLAAAAEACGSALASEHVAFVRAGGVESGHLLPVPRTRDALAVLAATEAFERRFLPWARAHPSRDGDPVTDAAVFLDALPRRDRTADAAVAVTVAELAPSSDARRRPRWRVRRAADGTVVGARLAGRPVVRRLGRL